MAASHTLDSDGVVYVNMATACAHGNWHAALNRYWSPLYPVLFSFWLRIFRPSPRSVIGCVRWFDFLLLVAALASFEFLLRLLRRQGTRASGHWLTGDSLEILGYTVFFWCTAVLTPPSVNPPDILVLIALLVAGGLSLRIAERPSWWPNYIALGMVLGFGYLSKAALFLVGPVFLVSIALASRERRVIRRLAVSLLIILLVSGPYLVALSRKAGHTTFGSAGSINYAIAVNYVDPRGYWRGETPGAGKPLHPITQLLDFPAMYEYAMADGGTLPLWLHHGYWYDGVRPHFELKRQINVVHICLDDYFHMLVVPLGPLLAAFLGLWLLERRWRMLFRRLCGGIALWGPAVAGLAMYALVHVEARFLGGFVILIWAALWLATRVPDSADGGALGRALSATVVGLLGLQIALAVGHSAAHLASGNPFPSWQVAKELRQEGVGPGDRVCYLGNPVWDDAWALVAQVQVTCNVAAKNIPVDWKAEPQDTPELRPSSSVYVSEYWSADVGLRRKIGAAFGRTGAKALIARDVPVNERGRGWKRAGNTNYFVKRLTGSQP